MNTDTAENRIGEFVDNGDGTFTDANAGLMWMRCSLGQTWDGTTCVGEAKWLIWNQAMALRHGLAGYDDWRLPNIEELKSLVNKTRVDSASGVTTVPFPKEPGCIFWSSSPDSNPNNAGVALSMRFDFGHTYANPRSESYRVRLVRDCWALGTSKAISNAASSPSKEVPVLIQVETRKDISFNVIESPSREEASGNFVARSDGTVTDIRTGLMWMRCALGQRWDGTTCVGLAQGYTWDEAMVQQRDFAGQGDWRLPDIDELKSIVDKTRCDPAIDTAAFPKAQGREFWSGSSYVPNPTAAWYVYFYDGGTVFNNKTCNVYVRLVRGGQTFGALIDDAISEAVNSPAKEVSMAIQVETREDVSTNIVDSPIREEKAGNFIVRSDGIATDTRTGLMWMRCALGQTWDGATCTGEPQAYTWDQAMALRHAFAGHDDWRMPDIDELKNVGDKTRLDPAIDTTAFPKALSSYFWSGSPVVGYSKDAWYVDFFDVHAYNSGRSSGYGVRFVRGGQVLDALNDDAIGKTTSSPANDAPVAIQVETHKDEPANINETPIREDTSGDFLVRSEGTVIIRAAIDFIKQHPTIFAAEIAELRAFLGEPSITPSMVPVEVDTPSLPDPQTLVQIIDWLTTLEMVTVSDLRARLLPLDLLPGAVIDDLNERALDLTGDLALEEDGENFIIVREVLVQVVALW